MGHGRYTSRFLSDESFKFDGPVSHHIGTTRICNYPATGAVAEIVVF